MNKMNSENNDLADFIPIEHLLDLNASRNDFQDVANAASKVVAFKSQKQFLFQPFLSESDFLHLLPFASSFSYCPLVH